MENSELLEELIKQEVIKFTEWLWVNIEDNVMSLHTWDYWYIYYKNDLKKRNERHNKTI